MINVKQITYVSASGWGTPQLTTNTIHYVEDSEMKAANVLLDSFKANNIATGDRAYFSKSSGIPRYKFGEYSADKNIARVIKLDRANAIVFNSDIVKGNLTDGTSTDELYLFDKSTLVGHSNHSWTQTIAIDKNIHTQKIIQNITGVDFSKLIGGKLSVYRTWKDTTFPANFEEFNLIDSLSNTHKMIEDSTLLEEINKGIEITQEVYQSLVDMLKSGDTGSIGLAMDCMANSDYRASEFKLALLLNNFHSIMSNTSNWKLRNFTSLLEYMKKYNWGSNPVQFASSIVKNVDISMPDAQERLDLAADSIKNLVNAYINSKQFTVDIVRVNA